VPRIIVAFLFYTFNDMKNVLVLCTGNSCRSQMAHGFLNHYTKGKDVKIYSAGIATHGINANAVATMKAINIDIADHTSNLVTEYDHVDFDNIITVCDHARENCPILTSSALQLHHNFIDPSKAIGMPDEINKLFAIARDEIGSYCYQFVEQYL
jgi:arsenate reductase (thioredoxin)